MMNNLLKISLVFLTLMITTTASAQLLPISLGIKGGVNMSTLSPKKYDEKTGFNAGLTLDVNLPANLAIMTGIEVNTKGGKYEDIDQKIEEKINAMYIQVPVHLGYRIKLLPGLRAHFDFGPYFAQGIGGKTKGEIAGTAFDRKTFGDQENQFKKSDWGLGVGVGVTLIGRIQVRAGYDLGLVNISRADDFKVKNRNLYVSAGFLIF